MSRASRASRASRSASRSNSKRGKAGLGASTSKRGLGADLSKENEYLKKQIEELRRTVKDQERELFEVRAQEDSGSSKEDELPKEKKMYGNTELTTAEGMPLVLHSPLLLSRLTLMFIFFLGTIVFPCRVSQSYS